MSAQGANLPCREWVTLNWPRAGQFNLRTNVYDERVMRMETIIIMHTLFRRMPRWVQWAREQGLGPGVLDAWQFKLCACPSNPPSRIFLKRRVKNVDQCGTVSLRITDSLPTDISLQTSTTGNSVPINRLFICDLTDQTACNCLLATILTPVIN